MLRLRKILLYDALYISILIISLIGLLFRLTIPIKTNNKIIPNEWIGVVEEFQIKEDKLTLTLKNKEKITGTYYVKKDTPLPSIHLGDKLKVKGTFHLPKSNTTEYLFNYKEYCKRHHILYTVEIDSIEIIQKNHNFYYYLKQQCITHLNNPYLRTFILGDKSLLEENVKRSYQENGISHLFAISGMHITLLVNLMSKVLKKMKIKEEMIFKSTMIFLLIYLSIIGPSPSIVRGILFYFFFTLNKNYYFYIKPINLFLLVLSISFWINPNNIYDVGYLYSYTISFTLISLSNILQGKNYFHSLLKVSLIAFLISIPITIYSFYQINVLGVLYNLFFVPFISIFIYPMSLIVSLLTPLEPIYNFFTNILEKLSLFLSHISFGKLIFKRLPFFIYIIYSFLLFIYIIFKKRRIMVIFLICLTIHYIIPIIDNREYLKMIDIGQGDSILLHSKNHNILVDTGGFESFGPTRDGTIYFHTLQPLFRSEGIHKLDYLILTHGDKDHLGESKTLIENMKVDKIILNDNEKNEYERQLPKAIKAKQGFYIHLDNIRMWQLNEDLEDENDSSQIYYVVWNNKTILLTGDASIKSEQVLLENYDLGHIDILKAGHHGSKTSTSEELLKEITPDITIISCGKDNKFKHPNQETIDKLRKYHIPHYRTDKDGSITIDMKKKTWSIKTCPP